MGRTLSLTGLQSALKQEIDEIFLAIIEITHDDLSPPLRFVNDKADITSNGDLYTAFPFRVAMPPDEDNKLPEVTLIISAVDQQIQNKLRALTSAPAVAYSVIKVSAPDTLEVGPLAFDVKGMDADAIDIRISIGFNSQILQERWPKDVFAPYNAE